MLAKYLRFSKWGYGFLAVGIFILAYVVIASYKLHFPGPQYDETLYLNGALGGVDKVTFLTKTFHGLPVLLMPYIGALKAWIFYPIFAIFGVNPITMRLPSILLTALGLFILYYVLKQQIGRRLSVLTIAVTALSASFIMFTRLDEGPVVLDFLLKVIGIGLLLSFARRQKIAYLGAFWFVMLLGTFNKLNFIWYVNSFLTAFVLIYGRTLLRQSKASSERKKIILVSIIGYLLNVAYYLYINKTYHLGSSFGFVGFNLAYSTLSNVIDGNWFYNYALSAHNAGTIVVFWLTAAIILAGGALLVWKVRTKRKDLPSHAAFYGFIGLTLLLLLGQIVMTKQATAGWHYFSVYPFVGILLVLGLDMFGRLRIGINWPALLRVGPMLVVGALCIYQLAVYRQYTNVYGKPVSNFSWSSSIYNLIDFAKAQPQSQFVSLDWGTQTQLIGYDSVPNKYYEVFGPIQLQNPVTAQQDFEKYIANLPNAYYVTHPASVAIFPNVTRDFFKLAEEHGYQPIQVASFKDGSRTIFVVYRLHY